MSDKYYVWSGSITNAHDVYVLAIGNPLAATLDAASLEYAMGSRIIIHDLRIINTAVGAVTGVAVEYVILKTTGAITGTELTPVPADSGAPALLHALVTCDHTATVTAASTLLSVYTNNEEAAATAGAMEASLLAGRNLLPTPIVCRNGHGLAVKLETNTTVGTSAVLAIIEYIMEGGKHGS